MTVQITGNKKNRAPAAKRPFDKLARTRLAHELDRTVYEQPDNQDVYRIFELEAFGDSDHAFPPGRNCAEKTFHVLHLFLRARTGRCSARIIYIQFIIKRRA